MNDSKRKKEKEGMRVNSKLEFKWNEDSDDACCAITAWSLDTTVAIATLCPFIL